MTGQGKRFLGFDLFGASLIAFRGGGCRREDLHKWETSSDLGTTLAVVLVMYQNRDEEQYGKSFEARVAC
jgi:hypothetical protein